MQATVTWDHGLSFEGTANSGFKVNLGGSPAVGGNDDGFRPMELIAIGLAGCTAMDVISILTKMRQEVTAFEVSAEADRADKHPKVFTAIRIHYTITGHNINPRMVGQAIELSEVRYCPAQAMLSKSAPIELSYEIISAE